MQGLGVHLHTKQHLEEANLCALELCKGGFATDDGPDLTAVAQYGLHKGIKQLALDNGVMYLQLLTSSHQAKHGCLGCLTEGLYGCWETACAMHADAQILEDVELLNVGPSI